MPDEFVRSERLAIVETEVKNLKTVVETGFGDVKADLLAISNKFDALDKKYVSKNEFAPVKAVVYSIVGAAGMAILGALIALVVK